MVSTALHLWSVQSTLQRDAPDDSDLKFWYGLALALALTSKVSAVVLNLRSQLSCFKYANLGGFYLIKEDSMVSVPQSKPQSSLEWYWFVHQRSATFTRGGATTVDVG